MPAAEMLTLAIEASNPTAPPAPPTHPAPPTPPGPLPAADRQPARAGVAVGLIGQGTVRALACESLPGLDDAQLLPGIDRAVRRAGAKPADLRAIAVSVGPGGFTGLRMAVAAAKMIALATGASCIAVPTARALARRAPADAFAARRPVAVCLAWKREDAWVEVFDGPSAPPRSAGLVALRAIAELDLAALIADGALIETMRQRGFMPAGLPAYEPAFDPVAVLEVAADLPAASADALAPLYPREPEAVTKWRALGRADAAR
ncbi:MAG: tRNA (adenosine(37)-N6)-threonylcarbamoyltransferase complex dimerization subunit type 1 TsaB [Planctomycetota bacterium]|nr:tRNA (adenosine(37)-N6)-threonylcarbamoyltransferase complex dimerization subunit type 1 TsaB [Planctomycetota bacterium]